MVIRQEGFTLIEMLLSIGIMAIITTLSLPVVLLSQARNDIASTTETLADALRRAETYARSSYGDSPWGVNFQTNAAILFQGASYATRTASYDETLAVPSDISIGYTGDVIFTKFTGLPTATASIGVTTNNNDSSTITVNSKGMVNY